MLQSCDIGRKPNARGVLRKSLVVIPGQAPGLLGEPDPQRPDACGCLLRRNSAREPWPFLFHQSPAMAKEHQIMARTEPELLPGRGCIIKSIHCLLEFH